jgi:hypothetical protein
MSESLGLTSHKSSCNCTGCGMLRAGVCINCAEKTTALILESGPEEIALEPCSGACREAIELYFSTPPERGARRSHDERRAKPLELGTELGRRRRFVPSSRARRLGLPLQHPL